MSSSASLSLSISAAMYALVSVPAFASVSVCVLCPRLLDSDTGGMCSTIKIAAMMCLL